MDPLPVGTERWLVTLALKTLPRKDYFRMFQRLLTHAVVTNVNAILSDIRDLSRIRRQLSSLQYLRSNATQSIPALGLPDPALKSMAKFK